MNGWQHSFHLLGNAVSECADGGDEFFDAAKEPRRRIAWRVMIPNNTSTMLSHESEVGVKRSVIRLCFANYSLISVFAGVAVVHHDVQVPARVGAGDLPEEMFGLAVRHRRR